MMTGLYFTVTHRGSLSFWAAAAFYASVLLLDKAPAVAAHILECFFRLPAKEALRFLGVGVDIRQVACAARAVAIRDGNAGGALERVHQLFYAHGAARAEVERLRTAVRRGVVQRLQMPLGQIAGNRGGTCRRACRSRCRKLSAFRADLRQRGRHRALNCSEFRSDRRPEGRIRVRRWD